MSNRIPMFSSKFAFGVRSEDQRSGRISSNSRLTDCVTDFTRARDALSRLGDFGPLPTHTECATILDLDGVSRGLPHSP